ncbi:helix-turn-helix transcriptional regulator [Belnapia sp. T18]|uniref:Helix-turn-helix transcriptional regulator n=1 Tax=Belnapia arida TaxID=2804533 RepID=A0ABS1U8W0_9PROT|nr:helix-turn-helix transcriptional regulator [Belnapia arida]
MLVTLARNARRRRERLDISLDELAARCGYPTIYLRDVEHGTAESPRRGFLDKLATALDTSIDDLLTDEPPVLRVIQGGRSAA